MAGLSFAAKDVFDVGGHVTGCGNPEWARRHDAALETAPVIEAMPMAGADFVGKIRKDERAYSPMGVTARMPDGSFSGEVAAYSMDVALGTDTGGSVRMAA